MPTRTAQANLYLQRINAVLDHVRHNVAEDLSLDALAQVAGFSPFHFHRLFKTLTGETVSDLVTRLRLERAVALLQAAPTAPSLPPPSTAAFNRSRFSRALSSGSLASTPGSGTGTAH